MKPASSKPKKGKSRQAAAYKGQKASPKVQTPTRPAPGRPFMARSEVATTFGPSKPPAGTSTSAAPGRPFMATSGKTSGAAKASATTATATATKPAAKTPAAKSPNKVTKKEQMLGKRYAGLVRRAKQAVNGDMSAAKRKDIVKARKQLTAMRKKLADKGYGKTFETKKGGTGGRGIYRSLTGKKASTIKKKSE